MRMLQKGHEANLKNVNITRLPRNSSKLMFRPSNAGSEKVGASSPGLSRLDMVVNIGARS